MTNNMDEFDHEGDFGAAEMNESRAGSGARRNIAEAWRSQPLFKLMVIMVVVGVAIAGALGVFSSSSTPTVSRVPRAPDISEVPGGKASQTFIDQNEMENKRRAEEALKRGGSAFPTPIGAAGDLTGLNDAKKEDPLVAFRAEAERLREEIKKEQQQNAQQIQVIQKQNQQPMRVEREDDTLAKAMQKQMQQLMEGWSPRKMNVVAGTEPKEKPASSENKKENAAVEAASVNQAAATMAARQKLLVQAGTVNYAQLLTEANSDVPGPILAQILSGPLAGGRAVGRFQVMNDYLVLTFHLVTLKGREYPVNVLALDPDTTLGGMATEVDHRYFDRVLLPAAASFASSFGSTLGQGDSGVVITDNATFVVQAEKSYKDALYEGLGQAGDTVSRFLQNEANKIKPLVRVAVGTPMGFFFLASVKEGASQATAETLGGLQGVQAMGIPGGSAAGGFSVVPGYGQTNYPYGYGSPTGVPGTGAYGDTSAYGTSGYNPYETSGYSSSFQKIPGTSVSVYRPGQTGLGTSYYGR